MTGSMSTHLRHGELGLRARHLGHRGAEEEGVSSDTGAGTSELTNEKCNKFTFHYAYDNYMLANGPGNDHRQARAARPGT